MATWNGPKNRWQASHGTGKARIWFYSKISAQDAEDQKRTYLEGPEPLRPGSLNEFIERTWWPRCKVPGRTTVSTRRGYMQDVKNHIAPSLGGMLLNDLTYEVLTGWTNELREKGLGKKTVWKIWGVLCSILGLAKDLNRLTNLDFLLVEVPKPPKRVARQDLNEERVAKIVGAAKGTDMEGPVWAASHLALRRNEVCGLKRTDVEVIETEAIVTLRYNRQPHGETQKLKSKEEEETRVLNIPKEWGEKLLSFGDSEHIYLFLYDRKRNSPNPRWDRIKPALRPIHPDRISKSMPDLCEKAKVPPTEFRELRTAAASNLRRAGVHPQVIADILGHSSLDTTTIYMDEDGDEQRGAFEAMRRKSR